MADIAQFLRQHAPFSGLEEGRLERVAETVEIGTFPAGTIIIQEGGEPSRFVSIVAEGAVELVDGDRVVDILEEGDLFGFPSMLSDEPPVHSVRARDDTVCYLIPDTEARAVLLGPSGMQFLTLALRQRGSLSNIATSDEGEVIGDIPLGTLVVLEPTTPIVEAAQRLTEVGATAAVVSYETDLGIVTDRDIRAKVVAGGIPSDSPVGDIATPRARTARADEPVATAIVRMLEMGIHHLPLVDARGKVIGMVTDLDLMGQRRRPSFRLRSEIDRAHDLRSLTDAAARIPETLVPLIRAGVSVDHIDVLTARLFDGVTIRLIELVQNEIGPPPVPFAWIALGASGRRDQGLRSTQDHAIVYGGEVDTPDTWFRELAEMVTEGLVEAGFDESSGGILATQRGWRGPEGWWRERIEHWMSIDDTEVAATVAAAFDGRVVTGNLDVRMVFRDAVEQARLGTPFLDRLRRSIVEADVPLGFLETSVTSGSGEAASLDVDAVGIGPITNIARLFSLSAGIDSVGTVRRLRESAAAGVVDPDVVEALEQAFERLRELRVDHQADQWTRGERPDTIVEADELGPLQRRSLRDTFRLIRDVQRSLDSGTLSQLYPR